MKKLVLVLLLVFAAYLTTSAQDETPTSTNKIAYIGEDHNVYTINADGDNRTALTTDADTRRHYQWPIWSTDGRLAYFCCDTLVARELLLQVFISASSTAPGKLIYDAQDESHTYAYWSPENCAESANCRDLAVLVSQAGAPFKVEIIRDSGISPSSQSVGQASPYYFSWNPEGTQLLRQQNGTLVNTFDVLEGENLDALSDEAGLFQAPQWSPVDDRLLYAVRNENNRSDLVISQAGEESIVLPNIDGLVAFNWSPDGQFIAYRVLSRDGVGALNVINAQTEEIVATSATESVIAFFWSPDSQKLAYITPSDLPGTFSASFQQNDPQLTWAVLDVTNGLTRPYADFSPTQELVYLLTYFDQFAQSHQLWSPDSTQLVYAETLDDDSTSITILDINAEDTVTSSVANGVIGIWSFD